VERYDLSDLDVLLVDNNVHMLSILRTALNELGVVNLRESNAPDDAFQMFQEHPADLIFSNWVPGRDELNFLNKIRDPDKSGNPFVPIIIVTAYSEQANVAAARDLGMTEFLATPVSVKSIYERICSVIKDKRVFIKEKKYFGPDRRRHKKAGFAGENRRSAVDPITREEKQKVTTENGLLNTEETISST